MEVIAVCLVIGWFLRAAFEDGVAAVRNTESPRIARKRARQEMARNSGFPPVGQAAAARIASVIAPSPGTPRRHPALEYLRTRWEDAWDELLESHHEEMRRRAQERRERQARDAERRRRESERSAEPYDDAIIDAEIVDPDPVVQPDPDEQECPGQTTTGWRETTSGAERTGGDFDEDQDGDAYYRRWEQPHPRGDGTLRTTITSWAQDDSTRRWIVTVTEWEWLGDDPSDVRFEDENRSDGYEDGPSGEPWPTPEDVRRTVDDIRQPADPDETPLADVLDASLCAGGCGTWVVGGMCVECENRRTRLSTPETPEPESGAGQHDPEPDQGPASTTRDSTDSGSAAHQEGTPVPQTTYINPDILDATGALRCAEGAAAFTVAVRRQMEKLAANAQAGLRGDVPAVQAIKAFEADIAATWGKLNALVDEHVTHVRTQAELAGDANLRTAAVGYLDSRHRA